MISLVKNIVPFEESTPETEPLFINHCYVSSYGHDVYLDVGVIPVDDAVSATGEARFMVLERLAMSVWTLATLKYQIDEILKTLEGRGINVKQVQSEILALSSQIAAKIEQRSSLAKTRSTKKTNAPKP